MQRSLTLCATSVLVLAALTGCSSSSNESASQGTETSGTSASATTQTPTEGTDAEPEIPVDESKVIATNEFTVPGHKNDKVKVGIQSLKVEGKTMTLQYVLTPDFDSVSESASISIFDMFGNSSPPTALVDRENLKEYTVISRTGQRWQADPVHSQTVNHQPIIWWGTYAAPEDGNETFDVRVIDSMAEFTDVPVTR